MLQSALNSKQGHATFPLHMLTLAPVPEVYDSPPVNQFCEEELHSIAPHRNDRPDDISDRGPYEAWRSVQAYAWRSESVMAPDTVWLRERAYVLWDGERVQKQTGGFGQNPNYETPYGYTVHHYEDMYESFRERSKIWRKGGRGYWSKSDTSRIVWEK